MYTNQSGVFNIYDYDTARPPDPTGVNDSSYAINAAATVAGSNGGGVVFVPPGNYQIQYTIVLPNNVQLVGSDQSDTSITAKPGLMWSSTVATNTTVMVTNSSNPPIGTGGVQTGVGVRDISFDGAAAAQSGVPGGANGAIIELVQVFGVRIQRCAIYNCQNNAIAINQGTEAVGPVPGDVKVLDNTIDVMAIAASEGSPATGGLAIIVTAFNNVIIRNNVIGYNPNLVKYPHWNPLWGGDGIDVLEASDVTISGNQITLVQNGITCDWGIDCVLTDNIVENFLGYGIQTERLSTEEATSAVSNLVIAGNAVVAAIGTSTTLSIAGIVASAGLNGADSTPTASHWAVGNNIVKGSVLGVRHSLCSV